MTIYERMSVESSANQPRGLARYNILDRFAVGGAAEIFRATDTLTGDLVAIKRLRQDVSFDPEMAAGFLRERQLAEQSKHRNLIHAFDCGTHKGAEWVALEFVDGKELADLLAALQKSGDVLPEKVALTVARDMLEGLAFAYNIEDDRGRPLGLVHRDLNPRNVLISFDGQVRVVDFGASHASLTEPVPSECVGSLGYLSPEQLAGHELDARSDIFAVGLVLYECLTGQPALPLHKGEAKVLKLQRKGYRPKLKKLSTEAREIIEMATAPTDLRYQSASAMRRDLDVLLGDEDREPALGQIMRRAFPS